MRYHIDTIPLWDAVKLQGECPICALRRKNELADVQRYLGASVMEPDTRIEVNKKGFCQKHHQMLFAEKNRLGHALLMDSHLKELEGKVNQLLKQATQLAQEGSESSSFKRLLSGKNASANQGIHEKAIALQALNEGCILCESVDKNMKRYTHTFFHLWQKDVAFKEAIQKSKGFCLPDTKSLLLVASEKLTGKDLFEFVNTIEALTKENLNRLKEELEWFTLKFDYRNQDKPWGNSKDSLERTINKLRGWSVGEEPHPDK